MVTCFTTPQTSMTWSHCSWRCLNRDTIKLELISIVWKPCRWEQFYSCQKACTKPAVSDFQRERQSFLLFSYWQCNPNTLLRSYNGGYIAAKDKPLLFILPCHEGDHQLRVRCYSESKPILWESEMCLTTISQTMPHQTASNPTGPARNSALSVCCKLHT